MGKIAAVISQGTGATMRYKIRSSDSKTPSSACHGGATAPPLASSEARTTRRELWNPVDDWEMKKPPPPACLSDSCPSGEGGAVGG